MAEREAWLDEAARRLRDRVLFEGEPLISVGFPSKSPLSKKRQRLGECWDFGPDRKRHIFITPLLSDPIEVLATLTHELVHMKAGKQAKHGKLFKREALRVGLVGLNMKSTKAGEDLTKTLWEIIKDIGPYPHEALVPTDRSDEDKQSTRLLKVICPRCKNDAGKPYVVRMTRAWITELGPPICPGCEQVMNEELAITNKEGETDGH